MQSPELFHPILPFRNEVYFFRKQMSSILQFMVLSLSVGLAALELCLGSGVVSFRIII
jgi:hypothetical protein